MTNNVTRKRRDWQLVLVPRQVSRVDPTTGIIGIEATTNPDTFPPPVGKQNSVKSRQRSNNSPTCCMLSLFLRNALGTTATYLIVPLLLRWLHVHQIVAASGPPQVAIKLVPKAYAGICDFIV